MEIHFFKYQGTGNDFIMLDSRKEQYHFTREQTEFLCDRRFGIGADGIILIKNHPSLDFEVVYINPDSSQSFCGNGTRCAVMFADKLGLVKNRQTTFQAYDGIHQAEIIENNHVRLNMNNVQSVRHLEDGIFIDTGSPHLVRFVADVESTDVFNVGRRLRYECPVENGTNVNFVQVVGEDEINVRTYERGVENETLSCGTGVTACAIAAKQKNMPNKIKINTRGGQLIVSYEDSGNEYNKIFLTGPAKEVFSGNIAI